MLPRRSRLRVARRSAPGGTFGSSELLVRAAPTILQPGILLKGGHGHQGLVGSLHFSTPPYRDASASFFLAAGIPLKVGRRLGSWSSSSCFQGALEGHAWQAATRCVPASPAGRRGLFGPSSWTKAVSGLCCLCLLVCFGRLGRQVFLLLSSCPSPRPFRSPPF